MSWPVSSDKWKAPQVNKKTAIKISGELNEFREDASFLFIFENENSEPIPGRYK